MTPSQLDHLYNLTFYVTECMVTFKLGITSFSLYNLSCSIHMLTSVVKLIQAVNIYITKIIAHIQLFNQKAHNSLPNVSVVVLKKIPIIKCIFKREKNFFRLNDRPCQRCQCLYVNPPLDMQKIFFSNTWSIVNSTI